MNELVRHIEFLLITGDCVVIPGFGAVLAHAIPSRFDDESSVLLPPSRTFTFNAGLTQNDGLLIASVSRSKSISYEAARHFVSTEVDNMQRALSQTGSLKLGRIGTLNQNDQGSLSFVPSTASALSPAYMWLPELRLRTVGELVKRRNALAEANEASRDRHTFGYYVSRVARVAASLAVLVALGFVLSTPIEIENAQYASLGIENFKTQKLQADAENNSLVRTPGNSSSALVLVIDKNSDATEIADTAAHNAYIRLRARQVRNAETASAVKAETKSDELRFNDKDSYCLVIASLASEADAQEYVAKSKNTKLGILSKDGRFRVYAATGEDLQHAQSLAKSLADRYPGAWVCRR